MNLLLYIILFSIISGVLSMAGGVALLFSRKWVKKFSVHFISFAAGALLAGAFLDLLPESVEKSAPNPEGALALALVAFIGFFVLDKTLNKVHCHYYNCDPEHSHGTPFLLLTADGIHNFVDGIIVASAFVVDIRLGIVTAVAVAAHELPQEISDFSVMLHHGWSKAKVFWSNFAVSLLSLIGALLAYSARGFIEPYLPGILAFTAGLFIYIAATDLLPEISPQTSTDKLSHIIVLLIVGVVIVWFIGHVIPVAHA